MNKDRGLKITVGVGKMDTLLVFAALSGYPN